MLLKPSFLYLFVSMLCMLSMTGCSVKEDGANSNENVIQTSPNTLSAINTKWEPRTISINEKQILYEFGKGNPVEVALKPDEYQAKIHKIGERYVTPEVEDALVKFLSSDALKTLMNSCSSVNRTQNLALSYPKDFDINVLLFIDSVTGRKEVSLQMDQFGEWLSSLWKFEQDINNSALNQCFLGDSNKGKSTLKEVRGLYAKVMSSYTNMIGN